MSWLTKRNTNIKQKDMITKKYYKLIRVSHADSEYFRITNISNETGEFSIGVYSSGTLEYSLDGVNWTSYDLTTKPSVNVNPNSNIYLRGTNFKNNMTSDSVINFNKDYTVGGNFMSLSNYLTMSSVTTIDSNNNIRYAFQNQTHLVSAGDLNLGNVSSIGYQGFDNVFLSCTSLTTGPDLSNVTTIGGSGLTSTFRYCASLTTSPDLSNVTSIGSQGLLNVFGSCTSLTTGPDLSNVTSIGSQGLSYAFGNCYKLSTATAPNISDLTQNSVLEFWLYRAGTSAAGTKTVSVPTGATITTDSDSGIPSGWTRVDY